MRSRSSTPPCFLGVWHTGQVKRVSLGSQLLGGVHPRRAALAGIMAKVGRLKCLQSGMPRNRKNLGARRSSPFAWSCKAFLLIFALGGGNHVGDGMGNGVGEERKTTNGRHILDDGENMEPTGGGPGRVEVGSIQTIKTITSNKHDKWLKDGNAGLER